jgi:hypothetical protein
VRAATAAALRNPGAFGLFLTTDRPAEVATLQIEPEGSCTSSTSASAHDR